MILRKKIFFNFFIGIFFLPWTFCSLSADELIIGNESSQKEVVKKESSNEIDSQYILGAGDVLFIKFEGLNIFTSKYFVNFQNLILLPEINNINVEGLTISDLKNILEKKYQDSIKNPKISIALIEPRPITVHLGGEVNKTGLYTLFFKNKKNTQEVFNLSGDNLLIDNYLIIFF